ncbi:MAG TPA: hypothetical protein VJ279_04190, partial [Hanamia sp.]|nr:hypothetical protein [Hanamia sp.]
MLTKEEIIFRHLNNRSIELGQGPLESDYLDDPIFKPLFDAVEEYANQDKWISVKDRLPENRSNEGWSHSLDVNILYEDNVVSTGSYR